MSLLKTPIQKLQEDLARREEIVIRLIASGAFNGEAADWEERVSAAFFVAERIMSETEQDLRKQIRRARFEAEIAAGDPSPGEEEAG